MSESDETPAGLDSAAGTPPRFDPVSAAMALVTSLTLAWGAWLWLGPGPAPEPPGVGQAPPTPLRLLDPDTAEPLTLALTGSRGRVVWVTFWSAALPAGRAALDGLEGVWSRLGGRSRFVMAAAAVEADRPGVVRAARDGAGATLPLYLAPAATRRAFGADPPHLPFHVLIDPTGRVGAVARGADHATLTRLADRAERWLDDLEPLGRVRFARR